MTLSLRLLGLTCLSTALGACDEDRGATPSASASAGQAAASASASPSVRPKPVKQRPPPCRVVRFEGKGKQGHVPLLKGAPLNGVTPLRLEAKAKAVVQHTDSTREYTLEGPSLTLPCFLGEEIVLVAQGRLRTSPQAGTRPGAAVILATPHGQLTYADAELELQVAAPATQAKLIRGHATAATATAEADAGAPTKLDSKTPWSAKATGDVTALLARCEAATQKTVAVAKKLETAKGSELGKLAAAHVRARRSARGVCSLAAAAALAATPEGKRPGAPFRKAVELNRAWRQPKG